MEHLLPNINNQDVVSEPLQQVNDETPEMLSTTSKGFREGKHLPNQASNISLESYSARGPEPVRKACPSLPKVKSNCPTFSKTAINS